MPSTLKAQSEARPARGRRAVNRHSRDGGELFVQVRPDLDLVVVDSIHAYFCEVVARLAQGNGLSYGGRPSLEPRRRFGVGALFEIHVGDHLATSHPRRHGL